jgi:hypothetical protein
MVRLPLTLDEVERGRRLGALLRRARGQRSILDVALDAVWAEINQPERGAESTLPDRKTRERLAS